MVEMRSHLLNKVGDRGVEPQRAPIKNLLHDPLCNHPNKLCTSLSEYKEDGGIEHLGVTLRWFLFCSSRPFTGIFRGCVTGVETALTGSTNQRRHRFDFKHHRLMWNYLIFIVLMLEFFISCTTFRLQMYYKFVKGYGKRFLEVLQNRKLSSNALQIENQKPLRSFALRPIFVIGLFKNCWKSA
jgi:hypothetical protein